MKYLLGLTLSTLVFFSCKESTDTEVLESTIIEDTAEETVVEKKFELFEDYTALKTKAEIVENFDSESLVHDTTYYAEGMHMVLRTTVTNPDNGHIIRFMFQTEKPNEVSFVEAHYTIYNSDFEAQGTQNIESETGLSTGMSLKDLREWNGSDFSFLGFGWDFGGGIYRENQPKFANCDIVPSLDMVNANDDQLNKFIGDVELTTNTEGIMDAPILVSMLVYYNVNEKLES